jgi:O-antigen ligase/tetratricopeptide (TPR) repeat protein
MKNNIVDRRYLIQEAVLILVFSYLILFASTFNGLMEWRAFSVLSGVILLVGISFLFLGQRMKSPMLISAPVFLGTLILSWIFSIDPARSEIEVWLLGAALLLFFVIFEMVGRGWPGELIIKVLLIVGAMVMAFCWLSVLGWYMAWLNASPGRWLPDIAYRLPSPNFMAVLINMLLMACLSRLIATRTLPGRIILGLYAVSAVGLILLTSSRGGWLGTAAGIGVLLWLNFRMIMIKARGVYQELTRKPILFGMIIIAFAACIFALGWIVFRQAFQPTHSTTIEGARSEFWGPALDAFKASPIIGQGPFTFPSFYVQFNSVPPRNLFAYSHSIYFDLLSSSGVVGLLGFLIMTIVQMVWLGRRYRNSSGMDRAVVSAALAAMAAFGVHGVFDSVHHTVPTSAWVLAILIGSASAIGIQPAQQKNRISIPVLIAFSLALMGGVHVWQEIPLDRGVAAGDRQDWQAASEYFTHAAERKPNFSVAYQQLGLAESVLALNGNKVSLNTAISAFERAIELDPTWALDHANLAALYHQQGNINEGINEIQKAIALAPDCAVYYLNLGVFSEDLGDEYSARVAYGKVLDLEPNWRGAAFWRRNEFRLDVFSDWLELYSEPPDTLDEQLADLASRTSFMGAYLPVLDYYDQQGDLSSVKPLIDRAAFGFVDFAWQEVELNWYRAAATAEKKDMQTAGILGMQAVELWRLNSLLGVGTFGKVNYNSFSYRRRELIREVVPQMIVIPLPDTWGYRAFRAAQWLEQSGDTSRAAEIRRWLDEDIPDWSKMIAPR